MSTGIQSRLLLITTLVLGSCLSLAGLVLDRAFQASVRAGAEEQLRLMIFSLMGTATEQDGRLDFTSELPEPRLGQPESGLYAAVISTQGELLWRSPSGIGLELSLDPVLYQLQPGQLTFTELPVANFDAFALSYAVIWEGTEERELVFTVLADQQAYQRSVQSFRRTLYIGLIAVVLLFVLAQVLAVRWGLRPLRTMAEEVAAMESGERDHLSEAYPTELKGLARNLDRFVEHEKRNRTRYRKALEDLAHSLKTPLAVLRNGLGAQQNDSLMREQLERMETSVGYQLSRASVAGPIVVGRAVPLQALLERLLRALQTAYTDRGIKTELQVPLELAVRGDERDLLEIFGNLLENGFKYTSSRLRVTAQTDGGVVIRVEDDGPGIEPKMRSEVLARGTRADEVQSGQGIGLSVVADLLALYRGSIRIEDSELGGALIEIRLPG